jgi:hypothetical protein
MYELTYEGGGTRAEERGMGRAVMLVAGLLTAILTVMLVRPRAPSPFTEHGGFGAGHGSQSTMFGANPRAGAPRFR